MIRGLPCCLTNTTSCRDHAGKFRRGLAPIVHQEEKRTNLKRIRLPVENDLKGIVSLCLGQWPGVADATPHQSQIASQASSGIRGIRKLSQTFCEFHRSGLTIEQHAWPDSQGRGPARQRFGATVLILLCGWQIVIAIEHALHVGCKIP